MNNKEQVLILCTGNSARSQMAEGLLRHDAGTRFEVESAGTRASFVRPEAIAVMRELGIDISGHRSKNVGEFGGRFFDYLITVCDNARETCPMFFGAAEKLHHSFEDPPPPMAGTEEERMAVFRRVRDELRAYLQEFANGNRRRSRRRPYLPPPHLYIRGVTTHPRHQGSPRSRRSVYRIGQHGLMAVRSTGSEAVESNYSESELRLMIASIDIGGSRRLLALHCCAKHFGTCRLFRVGVRFSCHEDVEAS